MKPSLWNLLGRKLKRKKKNRKHTSGSVLFHVFHFPGFFSLFSPLVFLITSDYFVKWDANLQIPLFSPFEDSINEITWFTDRKNKAWGENFLTFTSLKIPILFFSETKFISMKKKNRFRPFKLFVNSFRSRVRQLYVLALHQKFRIRKLFPWKFFRYHLFSKRGEGSDRFPVRGNLCGMQSRGF